MFIHYAEVKQPKAHIVRLSLEIPPFIRLQAWGVKEDDFDAVLVFEILICAYLLIGRYF